MGGDLLAVFASAFAAVLLAAWALVRLLGSTARRWRERFGTELSRGLQHSFLYLDTVRLFRLNLAVLAAVAGAAVWLTGQPLAALLVLVVLGSAPSLMLGWLRRRRLSRLVIQLPDASMLVAGALRSGGSLSQAIAQAAQELPSPAGRELDLVMREQRLGVSLDQAMAHLERRAPIEEITLFAAAVRISQETGGNLAETLERLAESLRRKSAIEGKIDALTAQGRLQGWVMALLPPVVGAVLFAIEPEAMRPLFATWQGWVVCAVIVLMEALGLHFIRRIVNIDV